MTIRVKSSNNPNHKPNWFKKRKRIESELACRSYGALYGGGGNQSNSLIQVPEILEIWDARSNVISSSERLSNHIGLKLGWDDAQSTGANQPIYVPYAGTSFAWNHGVAGNTLTTTTTSITGNFVLSLDMAADDWSPAGTQTLFLKNSGNSGILLQLLGTGILRLTIGDGAASTAFDSTQAVVNTNFLRQQIIVSYVDGASGSVTYSLGGVQLGNVVPSTVTLANAAVTANFMAANFSGKHYGVTLTNGAGTTYYNWDSSNLVEGATTFVGNDGKTYTFAQSGAVVCQPIFRPWIIYDGAAFFTSTGAQTLPQPCGVIDVGIQRVWTLNNKIHDGVSGLNTFQVAQQTTTPGIIGFSSTTQNNDWTLNTKKVIGLLQNGASSLCVVNQGTESTGTAGANTPNGLVTGARFDGTAQWGAFQLTAKAVINQAVTAARMREIIAMFQHEYGA